MADHYGLFQELFDFRWRNIPFPTVGMSLTFDQDVAEHKAYGVAGADLEATGRGPISFSATIPFRTNIAPAKQERWDALYPDRFREFLSAMADPSSGVLRHPELGDVRCKPKHIDVKWMPDKRDGCDVEAKWLEDRVEPENDTLLEFAGYSGAAFSLRSLEPQYKFIKQRLPKSEQDEPSLLDTFNAIAGAIDQVTLAGAALSARFARLAYRCSVVAAAANRAVDWPIRQNAVRAQVALMNLADQVSTTGGRLIVFITNVPLTLAMLASGVNVPVQTLMALNPDLTKRPVVPRATVVRYPAK